MGQQQPRTERAYNPSELYNRHSHLSALDVDNAFEFDGSLSSSDKDWCRFACHIYSHYLGNDNHKKTTLCESELPQCQAFSILLLNFKKALEQSSKYLRIRFVDCVNSSVNNKTPDEQLNKTYEVIKQAEQIGLIMVLRDKPGTALLLPNETLISFL